MEREPDRDDMRHRMHWGPCKDHMNANRKMSMERQPIKRTISQVSERKAPKGKK